MQPLAPGVWRFHSLWPYAFNAYYLEGNGQAVVVDAATRWAWPLLKNQLKGKSLNAVVLTHAHPDHQGCAARICDRFNAQLWCHEADSDSAEGKAPLVRHSSAWEFVGNLAWAGRRTPVTRRLNEGDDVAGFTVHHLPGHTRGSIALLRHSDGIMLAGDVINSNDYLTGMITVIREPPRTFSESPAQNRAAIRQLWKLKPSMVCPGHGAPVRDMRKLERFVSRMN